jgi:hypothetical protein
MVVQKLLSETVGKVLHPQKPDVIEEWELAELAEGGFLVVSQQ